MASRKTKQASDILFFGYGLIFDLIVLICAYINEHK